MDFNCLANYKPSKDSYLESKTFQQTNLSGSKKFSAENVHLKQPCGCANKNVPKKRRLNLISTSGEKNDNRNLKRINTDNQVDKKLLSTFNESGIDMLQDTFMCFDDTQTLINKSDSSSKKVEEVTFSQLCNNTQFLRQIENDISKSNEKQKKNCSISEDVALKDLKDLDDDFSLTQNNMDATNTSIINKELRKLKNKLYSTNDENIVLNASVLFNESELTEKDIVDEMFNIFKTSQYRKEVEMLFEKVEYSICELGPNQDQTLAKDPTEDVLSSPSKTPLKSTQNGVKWNDESLLAKAVLNFSPQNEKLFGNIIKKALLENAKKTITPGKSVNTTIIPCEPTFNELGDFYGLPQKVKDLMKMYRGIEHLYEWQNECLNLQAIKDRTNLVYALPTSGGKTLVAEILILREILCWKRNALFILPYVAIVQEKVWGLSPFAVSLDFLVEEYAAGKGNYPPRKRRRKNSVYVATIEKALGLVNSLIDVGRIEELGLVVVDELHLIGDQSRGSTLEELLSKLLCFQENIQIIGMSATIGNLSEICKFLNANVYTQNFRPVELTEYVKCGDELAKINWQAADEDELLIFERKCNFSYSEKLSTIDPDRLGGLIMEVVPNDSCLVFCSSKKNCENVAYLLCRVIPAKLRDFKSKEKDYLKKALKEESGNLCNILNTSISFGIAYHHSGLTADERRLIEDGFRAGVLSVICCTSTLAAGVNLPARRVILRQPYIGREFINLSRYKQMVGRAGRAGLGSTGDSIMVCTSQDLPKVKELFLSPMDQALSSLHENGAVGLRQLLLSCISLNIATTRGDLHKIVKKTLLAVQESKLEVQLKKVTDKAIIELFKLGALKIDDSSPRNATNPAADVSVQMNSSNSIISTPSTNTGDDSMMMKKSKIHVSLRNDTKLIISKLGTAAIKSGLELTKAHLLYDDLLQAQASLVLLSCLHLLYLVTPYDISEQVKPSKSHYYKFYTQLGKNELQTAKIVGLTESCAVRMLNNQPIKTVSERVLNRFYVTLMLYDLWNEVSIFQVAEKFEMPRGLVQNLMTSAATFASNVVNFCSELEEFWAFAYLLRGMTERLQHCCVRELLPLMELPSVKQGRAKQLYNAGYKTLALIAKADPNDLVENIEYMSRRVANQLIAAAKLLLLERVENLREEAEDVLDGIEPKLLNYSTIK